MLAFDDACGLEPEGVEGLDPEGGSEQPSWDDTFAAFESNPRAEVDLWEAAAAPASAGAAARARAEAALITLASGAGNHRRDRSAARPDEDGAQFVKGMPRQKAGFGYSFKAAPRAPGGGVDGSLNVDKRTCRKLYKDSFVAAIATHREAEKATGGGAPAAPAAPPAAQQPAARPRGHVTAWVRKRPLLPAELERGEYEAATTSADGRSLTTHACLMKPDLRRMFLRHSACAPAAHRR